MKASLSAVLACAVAIAFFLPGDGYAQGSPGATRANTGVSAGTVEDPVCRMDVDKAKAGAAGRKSEYQKKAYYFCSDHCKKEFDKDPAKYLKEKAKADNAARRIDPVCGMDVDPATARFRSEYRGAEYYFCSESCKRAFDANPQKYQKKS